MVVIGRAANARVQTFTPPGGLLLAGVPGAERDQYSAVTLGFGKAKEKRLAAAQKGAFKKAAVEPRRVLKEFRVTPDEAAGLNVGEAVSVGVFEKGQLVDVTGITKGRGFQGVMKRWNFRGFGQTHGTHEYRRHPGAIGQRKTPGRVYPNKKMPGHYGVEQVTTQNLTVVDVDAEKNLLLVKGAVPGHSDGIVFVRPSVKVALRARHAGKK